MPKNIRVRIRFRIRIPNTARREVMYLERTTSSVRSLCRLVSVRVVHLLVPHELHAGDELLELQAHVQRQGDDVVVQHHPQQQHL
jgi:hypothetical protein